MISKHQTISFGWFLLMMWRCVLTTAQSRGVSSLAFVATKSRRWTTSAHFQPVVRPFAPRSYLASTNNNKDRRQYSSDDLWKVPEYLAIPEDQLEFSFVRSSGAGGQNVNKVNSQVQIKLHVSSAYSWIPHEVQQRILKQQANRINREGYLIVTSQEHRTQTANRKEALQKLRNIVLQAWPRPKQRKIREGISVKTKQERKEFKRRRSQVKENRKRVDF